MLTHTGGGKRPMELSNKMSDALLAFMHNGNPNCKSLPNWPEYTPENGEVMILMIIVLSRMTLIERQEKFLKIL